MPSGSFFWLRPFCSVFVTSRARGMHLQPKIKVENDGGIISGIKPAAAAYAPYFIHVNDAPHIQIPDAKATGGTK